jgi:hypothetical protein
MRVKLRKRLREKESMLREIEKREKRKKCRMQGRMF